MSSVSERPILFSGPMVKAVLQGRKTQTRRVVTDRMALDALAPDMFTPEYVVSPENSYCRYGNVGDRLWVRESMHRDEDGSWHYSADCETVRVSADKKSDMLVWAHHKDQDYAPSIHMPRWASRITLDITKIRVERLQDISVTDAIAEGMHHLDHGATSADCAGKFPEVCVFKNLWDSINSERGFGWNENPWVWVIEFKIISD